MIQPTTALVSALLLFWAQCLLVQDVSAEESTSPNIMVIVTDDQRWDEFGLVQVEQGELARFPFIKTPRLDALAAEGMRFRNAFVTTSLCSPGRSSILTGQYNHTNGIVDNFTPFLPRPTWATALQAEGYTTAMIGKWHHGNQLQRPGFDYVNTFIGQGRYHDTPFFMNGKRVETKGYIDERTVDFAIDFLEDYRQKPFAMLVGLKAVHQPFTPMDEHTDNYLDATVRPSPNWDSVVPWRDPTVPMRQRTPRFQNFWMDIFRTLDGVDQNVGRLLDALDRLNLADNTLVIFTSDNGYYLGEHRLGDKRSAYEESMRVPLIARLPGVIAAGTVSDAMVLNIDLAPTILDLVISEVPDAMQGESMLPLFSESMAPWREAFLYEYWQENERGLTSSYRVTPSLLAVRTATHKLITYTDYQGWNELYDLEADPYETRNLYGYAHSRSQRDELCSLLRDLLVETNFVDRPDRNKWLLDFTNPRGVALNAVRAADLSPRPPLKYSNC